MPIAVYPPTRENNSVQVTFSNENESRITGVFAAMLRGVLVYTWGFAEPYSRFELIDSKYFIHLSMQPEAALLSLAINRVMRTFCAGFPMTSISYNQDPVLTTSDTVILRPTPRPLLLDDDRLCLDVTFIINKETNKKCGMMVTCNLALRVLNSYGIEVFVDVFKQKIGQLQNTTITVNIFKFGEAAISLIAIEKDQIMAQHLHERTTVASEQLEAAVTTAFEVALDRQRARTDLSSRLPRAILS